jgi:hypothetical protein
MAFVAEAHQAEGQLQLFESTWNELKTGNILLWNAYASSFQQKGNIWSHYTHSLRNVFNGSNYFPTTTTTNCSSFHCTLPQFLLFFFFGLQVLMYLLLLLLLLYFSSETVYCLPLDMTRIIN